MSEDVLTPNALMDAMKAMRDAPPLPPRWVGPPWAGDHLKKHEGGKAGCETCRRAWAVMWPL